MKYILTILISVLIGSSAVWILQEKKWSLRMNRFLEAEREASLRHNEVKPLLEEIEILGRVSAILNISNFENDERYEENNEYMIEQLEAYKEKIRPYLDDPRESKMITYVNWSDLKDIDNFYTMHPKDQMRLVEVP